MLFLPLFLSAVRPAFAHHLSGEADVAHWNAYLWVALGVLGGIELWLILRARRGAPAESPSQERRVEQVWTVVPVVVLGGLLVLRFGPFTRPPAVVLANAGSDAVTVEVMAHQWAWDFHYPQASLDCRGEMHIPCGQPVRLVLKSTDILHSFDVPQLGLRGDCLPGQPVELCFRADVPGRYDVQCSAICGGGTQEMAGVIAVEPPNEYTVWVQAKTQKNPAKQTTP